MTNQQNDENTFETKQVYSLKPYKLGLKHLMQSVKVFFYICFEPL